MDERVAGERLEAVDVEEAGAPRESYSAIACRTFCLDTEEKVATTTSLRRGPEVLRTPLRPVVTTRSERSTPTATGSWPGANGARRSSRKY